MTSLRKPFKATRLAAPDVAPGSESVRLRANLTPVFLERRTQVLLTHKAEESSVAKRNDGSSVRAHESKAHNSVGLPLQFVEASAALHCSAAEAGSA